MKNILLEIVSAGNPYCIIVCEGLSKSSSVLFISKVYSSFDLNYSSYCFFLYVHYSTYVLKTIKTKMGFVLQVYYTYSFAVLIISSTISGLCFDEILYVILFSPSFTKIIEGNEVDVCCFI